MKIGLNLPQMGHLADANATQMVAVAAEAAGFSSLWVIDRLLAPVAPRSPYPGTADGSLPVEQQRVLDPLVALSFAASVTERIRVGTDVLVAPWYPPALLARSLATLDHISNGRLTVGLGLGWSVDEYDAVGVPMAHLGARLEEIIDVMTSLWHDETVSVETSRERIAPSIVGLKPTQSRLPLLLASFNPAGLEARRQASRRLVARRHAVGRRSRRCGRRSSTWPSITVAVATTCISWCAPIRSSPSTRWGPIVCRSSAAADRSSTTSSALPRSAQPS